MYVGIAYTDLHLTHLCEYNLRVLTCLQGFIKLAMRCGADVVLPSLLHTSILIRVELVCMSIWHLLIDIVCVCTENKIFIFSFMLTGVYQARDALRR